MKLLIPIIILPEYDRLKLSSADSYGGKGINNELARSFRIVPSMMKCLYNNIAFINELIKHILT